MRVLEAFGEPVIRGGQEAFVFGVIEHMNMEGLTIDCLTPYQWEEDGYRELVRRRGGAAYALELPFSPGSSRRNVARPVREFLSGHRYDVIHIHSGSISILTIMAAEADRAGIPKIIVHSHATGEIDSFKHRLLRFLASLSMRRHVDVYCACSMTAAEWKFEPMYARKAIIIRNGIDVRRYMFRPDMRTVVRNKLGLNHQFVIGNVGRFGREKNHEFLIEIFEAIVKQHPGSVLLLVGDGEEWEKIQSMVISRRLSEKVYFTGSVGNVEDYIQAMDVFVLPSLYEGLGIVAIEAQAAGLPVIASTKVPADIGLSEAVVFLPLEDGVERWANAIVRMSGMTDREDGSEQVRQAGYDVHAAAEQVRRMYIE